MKSIFLFLLTVIVFMSCSKNDDPQTVDDGIDPAEKEKAAALQTFLQTHTFKLARYYSDSLIDYIDTDAVVKAEKDLWEYVSIWLKDDRYGFQTDNQAVIEQNADKIETEAAAVIKRKYVVTADREGVLFKFVNHQYEPLNYRLISMNDSAVNVSATWNGKTVNSEYKVSP
jgi:hypothetical protein